MTEQQTPPEDEGTITEFPDWSPSPPLSLVIAAGAQPPIQGAAAMYAPVDDTRLADRLEDMASKFRSGSHIESLATIRSAIEILTETPMEPTRRARHVLHELGILDIDRPLPEIGLLAQEVAERAQAPRAFNIGYMFCLTGNVIAAPMQLAVAMARVLIIERLIDWSTGEI